MVSVSVASVGFASAQLTQITVKNETSIDLTVDRVDPGAGFFSPPPSDPLAAGLEQVLTHESNFPTVTAGRLEYDECDLYFSKFRDFRTGAWSFTADLEDNFDFSGNIECEVKNLVTDVFTGEFSFDIVFTEN